MNANTPMREDAVGILNEAAKAVGTDRDATHGPMYDNMAHTASLWSSYLGVKVRPIDVPIMMNLLKISRVKVGDIAHRDHYVDGAGYLSIAGSIAEFEYGKGPPAKAPVRTAPAMTPAHEGEEPDGD